MNLMVRLKLMPEMLQQSIAAWPDNRRSNKKRPPMANEARNARAA
jgi:hypothetical protein